MNLMSKQSAIPENLRDDVTIRNWNGYYLNLAERFSDKDESYSNRIAVWLSDMYIVHGKDMKRILSNALMKDPVFYLYYREKDLMELAGIAYEQLVIRFPFLEGCQKELYIFAEELWYNKSKMSLYDHDVLLDYHTLTKNGLWTYGTNTISIFFASLKLEARNVTIRTRSLIFLLAFKNWMNFFLTIRYIFLS